MPRHHDSARIDLAQIFLRVQNEMLACLAVGEAFEHPSACDSASEQRWIALFNRYLPQRYRASPVFIVDADGRRSRQIDVAIYDNLYSPLIFPHESGLHLAAESVYVVFEVKLSLTRQWIRDAGSKAATVRSLRRTSVPILSAGGRRAPIRPRQILAGILAMESIWGGSFQRIVNDTVARQPPDERLDLGCALRHGAFEWTGRRARFSSPEESLIFFVVRLMERLRAMGTAPAADLMEYGRALPSFRPFRKIA
jgi:hypothetical protein